MRTIQHLKLIHLLKTLNKKEIRRLAKFVQSPWFNESEQLVELFALLRPFYPEFSSPRLSQEKLYAKLYPKETFNAPHFGVLISRLAKLVKEFMVQEQLQKTPLEKEKWYIKSLLERTGEAEKELLALKKKVLKQDAEGIDYFGRLAEIAYLNHLSIHSENYNRQHEELNQQQDFLDKEYLLQKIRYACMVKHRKRILNDPTAITWTKEMQELGQTLFGNSNVHFSLYQLIFDLLKQFNLDQYTLAKSMFFSHSCKITLYDRKIVFHILLSIYLRQPNLKTSARNEVVFDFYEKGLSSGLLELNGVMSSTSFINIVSTAGALKKFKWTEDFIQQYAKKLDKEERPHTVGLSLAYLRMFEGRYQESEDLLLHIVALPHHRSKTARGISLRNQLAFLEQDLSYYDTFSAKIVNYERYIQRSELLSEKVKKRHLATLRYFKTYGKLVFENKLQAKYLRGLLREIKDNDVELKVWWMEKLQMVHFS